MGDEWRSRRHKTYLDAWTQIGHYFAGTSIVRRCSHSRRAHNGVSMTLTLVHGIRSVRAGSLALFGTIYGCVSDYGSLPVFFVNSNAGTLWTVAVVRDNGGVDVERQPHAGWG